MDIEMTKEEILTEIEKLAMKIHKSEDVLVFWDSERKELQIEIYYDKQQYAVMIWKQSYYYNSMDKQQ